MIQQTPDPDLQEVIQRTHRAIHAYRPDVTIAYVEQVITAWLVSQAYPFNESDQDIVTIAESIWVEKKFGADTRLLAQQVSTALHGPHEVLPLRTMAEMVHITGAAKWQAAADALTAARIFRERGARRWHRVSANVEVNFPPDSPVDDISGMAGGILASPPLAQMIVGSAWQQGLMVIGLPVEEKGTPLVLLLSTAGANDTLAQIAMRFAPESSI